MSLWGGKDKKNGDKVSTAAKAPGRYTRRVQETERKRKQRRRRRKMSLSERLGSFVAIVAIICALAITALALLSLLRPAMVEIDFLGEDYRSNIVVGAVYFWIEVAAIIVGVRLLDVKADAVSKQNNIRSTVDKLTALDTSLFDVRYNFAVKLDTATRANGSYKDVNFFSITNEMVQIRANLIEFFLIQPRFGAVESKIFDRTMRCFDVPLLRIRDLASEAQKINGELASGERQSKQETPETPAVEPALLETARTKRARLEHLVEQIMDDADTINLSVSFLAGSLDKVLGNAQDEDGAATAAA